MPELVIVAFKGDKQRAAAVLNEIRERDAAWTHGLHGAIAVYRNSDKQLAVDQSFQSTRGGMRSAAVSSDRWSGSRSPCSRFL